MFLNIFYLKFLNIIILYLIVINKWFILLFILKYFLLYNGK